MIGLMIDLIKLRGSERNKRRIKMVWIFQPGCLGEYDSLRGSGKQGGTGSHGQGLVFGHVKFEVLNVLFKWSCIADIWKWQAILAEIMNLW